MNLQSCSHLQLCFAQKRCSWLFMICQYGPLQKIVRLALSGELLSPARSLSFRVTVAFLWSSPSHLSPCQDSSLIYHKAFIQINTATQQLPRTHKLAHTHTHTGRHTQVHFVHQHAPRFWLMIRAKPNTVILGSPVCLIPVFLFCRLFSLNTLSSFFIHLIFDCSPSILSLLLLYLWESSALRWRRRWSEEDVEGKS